MANDLLLGRAYKLTVGPAGGEGRSWEGRQDPSTGEWQGLRIRFDVHRTADSVPNKCEVDIYNLSKDSRSFIEGAGKDWAIVLEAGYETTMKSIFSGRLELGSSNKRGRHNHHHQGPDWCTKLSGYDGLREYRYVVLSKSFGPKTTEGALVKHIAQAMGATLGKIKGLDKHKGFAHGRQLTGAAGRELETLCRSRGLRWMLQDGVLHVLPYGDHLDSEAFFLSPATGLVGSPEKTERGVKVVSLMQAGITPGRLIDLDSTDLKGVHVAESVIHRGDSHYQDWYTESECFRVST